MKKFASNERNGGLRVNPSVREENSSSCVSGLVAVAPVSSLALTLRALQPLLTRADVTDICINRPGEAFVETPLGWERLVLPFAHFAWCYRLAKLVAHATRQRIAEDAPLLSATLPGGERVQIAIPPATAPGCVAFSIRRPSQFNWGLRDLGETGVFRRTHRAEEQLDGIEIELQRLLVAQDYESFLRLAVRSKKNIVISGPTGSGKTTYAKALIREIPINERLITIEDAPELTLADHPNHVRLFYSKGEQGQAPITPRDLLENCLRMRPDRILLAELRSEEAFEYLRNANSGHPGSITSVHAASAELAFEQLTLLVKQSVAGRDLPRTDIHVLLHSLVDIVVQCGRTGPDRGIEEIWYDPMKKRRAARG